MMYLKIIFVNAWWSFVLPSIYLFGLGAIGIDQIPSSFIGCLAWGVGLIAFCCAGTFPLMRWID